MSYTRAAALLAFVAITYVADTLPRGGQVRITTTDPEAIVAIHAFLAFQRHDHRATGH